MKFFCWFDELGLLLVLFVGGKNLRFGEVEFELGKGRALDAWGMW